MSQPTFDDDDEEVEDDDDRNEDPDPSDQDDSGDADMLPCPFCRKPVYHGADLCPHCRNYIALDDPKSTRKLWVLVGGALALAAVIMAYVAFTVRAASE